MERAERFRQASEQYLEASRQETDKVRKAQDASKGAEMAYWYAYNALGSGDVEAKQAARRALANAQPYAADDAELSGRIAGLLREF